MSSLVSATLSKGEQTRRAIIEVAIEQAAAQGLEGLTIGSLAERMQMSKSGVYAHCGSREELQIAVLQEYERRFIATVLKPALDAPRGLVRLRAIFGNWLALTALQAQSGCIMISGAVEYDDRPGAVRDELVLMVRRWQAELTRAIEQAVDVGDLPGLPSPAAMVFELHGIVLSLHHDARLLRNTESLALAREAFDRLIDGYRRPGGEPAIPGSSAIRTTHSRASSDAQKR